MSDKGETPLRDAQREENAGTSPVYSVDMKRGIPLIYYGRVCTDQELPLVARDRGSPPVSFAVTPSGIAPKGTTVLRAGRWAMDAPL